MTCLRINECLKFDKYDNFQWNNSFYTCTLSPHTSSIYNMLKSVIKITCTIDKNKFGGRDNGLLESTELVAGAETSSKGECCQAALMGTSQDALGRERRVSTCESVKWRLVGRASTKTLHWGFPPTQSCELSLFTSWPEELAGQMEWQAGPFAKGLLVLPGLLQWVQISNKSSPQQNTFTS